jgi:hypothetical protein
MAVKLIHSGFDPNDSGMVLGLRIDAFEEMAQKEIFHKVIEICAEKYVSENYAGIVKCLDHRAIATLALGKAGHHIADAIQTNNINEATERLERLIQEVLERQRRI